MSEYTITGSSTLKLTAYCFDKLMIALMTKLDKQHPGILKKKVGQIYGFGGQDESAPSLKSELQALSGTFINGKYVYDKQRELASGKPFIKINKPYNLVLFEYLGYDNVLSFIKKELLDDEEKSKQIKLIQDKTTAENHYYISYHFGEYKKIVKSQTTVKDNWKRVEYKYVYPQDDGTVKYFTYYGDIKKRADALHIQTRTFLDGKMVPSGENILYIGYGDPAKSKYLLGVFSAFDINNKLIAVKSIHEKCTSKEEMVSLSLEKKVPGYIAQELRNQRIQNEIHIPNDKMELSPKSPYYLTYEKISGNYKFQFESNQNDISELGITIDPDTYKITSSEAGILINNDDIQLVHNASILNIKLTLSGQTPFLQLDIYIKTYYLKDKTKKAKGKFCGIDFENRLSAGDVSFLFESLDGS